MATDVVARLKLRAEDFSRQVRRAFDDVPNEADRAGREAGGRLGAGIGAGLKAGIAAVSVGAIVREIAQVTARAVDFGVELGNNARALNTNVEELQAYREAAGQVNIVHQRLDDGLQELLKTMVKAEGGNKDATAAFKQLGISLRDADGQAKTTTTVMGEVVDQLRRIPDPLRQAQYGAALFGDQWKEIAPILDAGSNGLQRLTGEILATGDALSTNEIQELERINSEFERMKNTLEVDISQAVAANADAIIGLARALADLAAAAVTAASSWMQWINAQNQNAKVKDPGFTGGLFTVRPASNVPMTTRPGKGDPTSYFGGLLKFRPADRKIRLPKGGRGGGRAYDEDRIDDREIFAPTPTLNINDPLNPARLGGGSTGSKKRGGGGGVDRAEREREQAAKRLRAEYDKLGESLEKDLRKQQQAAEVEAMRAVGLDRMAEQQEALNQLNDRYSEVAGKTAEEVAKRFGISVEQARDLIAALEQLRQGEILKIDIEFDQKAMGEISKDIDRQLEQTMERQNEAMQKARDKADEIAREHFEDLSSFYFDLFDGNTKNIWANFKRLGLNALAELASKQTMKLVNGEKVGNIGDSLKQLFSAEKGDVIGGMSKGALASEIAGAIGIKQSQTGAMIGSAIGSFLGPLGGAIGGFLGGTIGGLFKKTKTGSATVGFDATGDLATIAKGGNSAKFQKAAGGLAGSLTDQLNQIAEMLGATLNSGTGGISFGIRKGQIRVDPTGAGRTKAKNGVVDFGEDEQAAVRYAVSLMLQRGIIGGISDASQRIIKAAGDNIEEALEKAIAIESIPKLLRARLDPLGAELDAIDEKFRKLADTLREGGASAEQIAQARQLWELERADAVREIGDASSTLRDFLKTLRIGADSPLSLRTQAVEAEAAMAPFIKQIRDAETARAKYDALSASKAAGGAVTDAELKAAKDAVSAAAAAIDQSGFRDSAAMFLDITRQLGGSTKSFFDQFERVQGLTNSAIALVENAVPLRGDAKDPFIEATAKNTADMVDLLSDQNALFRALLAAQQAGGGADFSFIGGGRNFLAVA